MKFKSTIITGVVFALLGAYVLYSEIIGEKSEDRNFVHQLDFEDIVSFELIAENDTVSGSRRDTVWFLDKPAAQKGDSVYINAMLNAFVKAERLKNVDDVSARQEQFGLTTKSLRLTVEDRSGRKYSIEIGNRNPTGRLVYASVPGSDEVFLTDAGLSERMNQDPYYFRDKTILEFDADRVRQLNFYRNGKNIVLEKENSVWNIIRPLHDEADVNVVKNLMTRLRTHKISDFQPPGNLEELGLKNPDYQTELVFDDGDKKSVFVGKQSGPTRYMHDSEKEIAYKVDTAAVSQMIPGLMELRNKVISTFIQDSVSIVKLNYPGVQVEFEYDDSLEAWFQSLPEKRRAVNDEIDHIVSGVYWARASGFVDEKEKLEKYGLDSNAAEIVLMYGDEIAAQVRVGRHSGNNVFYYNVLKDRVFLVQSNIHSRLVVPQDQLLWKR